MNNKLIKALTVLCALALLVCGLAILFRNFHFGLSYANAEKYTAGAAELDGPVKNLDIHWIDGAVNVAYHKENTVLIAETAPKAISGDAALRWWLDGDTLRVQYAKSGYFSFRGQNKALTLTLPEGVALGKVDIGLTSGDVNAPGLRANDVSVTVTSGDVSLQQLGESRSVALSCTSGSIAADLETVGKLNVHMTSGDVETAFDGADEVSLSTTSGAITVTGGGVRKAEIGSTSGDIEIRLDAFSELRTEATSGSITAALPSEPGYQARVNTTSGRFDYNVSLTRDGGTYTCGDGSASVSLSTTSGNVLLKDASEE